MVVIEYRSRGLHVTLLPPLLILLAALAITTYQRQARSRPRAPAKALAAPAPGRNIFVAPSGTGATVETLTLRPLLPTAPAPPLEPIPTSATPTTPLPGPPAAEAVGEPLADADADVDAGRPGDLDPASPFDRAEAAGPSPSPSGEPERSAGSEGEQKGRAEVTTAATERTPLLDPPDPPTPAVAEELPADSPELTFRVAGDIAPAAGDRAGEPEPKAGPKVTKEQILADIQGEAALRKAEQKNIERDMAEAKLREYLDVFHKLQDDRPKFHAELRQILREPGEPSDKIKQLCERYGRDPLPEVKAAVSRALQGSAAGLRQDAKIKLMRTYGVPEAAILDFLANDLHKKINTRGGPRNPKDVRKLAAKHLLAYPPAPPHPKAGGTTSPVSQVTHPTR